MNAVLVVGATGNQGGAVARALLAANMPVRALVRDPSSEAAAALTASGMTVVAGDLDDTVSLRDAMIGVTAVFSNSVLDFSDLMGDAEVRRVSNLVTAARAAAVQQIVHSSVSGTANGDPDAFDANRWGDFPAHYWRSKIASERTVRSAGFPIWTILRPAIFMTNLQPPSTWFSGMTSHRLAFVGDLDRVRSWIAIDDIGFAACAAFKDPARFHQVELELASDELSVRDAVTLLNTNPGPSIELPDSPEQAHEWGIPSEIAQSQKRMDFFPAPARPSFARSLGIHTTTFSAWAGDARRLR